MANDGFESLQVDNCLVAKKNK